MCRNTIDFGFNSSDIALWCLEVVPVVYARVFTYAERAISSKVHKMMQYTCTVDHMVLQRAMKVNMMKSHFNLLQLILVRILWHTSYLKDNSWMCILHQYHKVSGLKACTAMCRSEKKCSNIYLINSKWRHPRFFSGKGGLRIWNNYVEIQCKSIQVIFIILLCTWGYNTLGDMTRQHRVWSKTCLNTNWSNRNFVERIFV